MVSKLNALVRAVVSVAMVMSLVTVAPASAEIGGLVWERSSAPGSSPFDVTVDSAGDYYIACPGSGTVEKFLSDGTHAWTFDTNAAFESYVAHLEVDDTGLYIGIAAGSVAKLDKSTGSIIWTASGIPGGWRVVCDVAAYNGVVYVTQPGIIGSWFTLDAETGAYIAPIAYDTPHPEDSYYYLAVDATGIYVWTNDSVLHRLDSELDPIWQVPMAQAGGMVLDGEGFLYVADDTDGVVRKVAISDGSVVATLYGQDGCVGAGYLNGIVYTTLSGGDLVRAYAEPWPDPTAPKDVVGLASPTHPDPATQYPEDSPGFTWGYDAEKLYSWSVDQDPAGEPDLTADAVSDTGDSVLGSPTTYQSPYDPFSIASGDFDEDGQMDFAAGFDDDSYGVTVFLNKGGGTFETDVDALEDTSYAPDTYADDINVADMDGDGHLDIVFFDELSTYVGILWGVGDGTFTFDLLETLDGDWTNGLTVGDFDGQAGLDIALNFDSEGMVEVWKGAVGTPRQFTKEFVPFPEPILGSTAIGAPDLNGDGRSDLVISTTDGGVLVAMNDGDGGFSGAAMSIEEYTGDGSPVRMFRFADIDDDGDMDVVASGSDSMRAFTGDGSGGLTLGFDVLEYLYLNELSPRPREFALGDVDNDGNVDIVFGDDDEYDVYALTGNGDGTFKMAGTTAVDSMRGGGRGICCDDFDGDGRDDAVIAGSSEIHVLLGIEPSEYNVQVGPLADGTWYFHVREVNQKDGEWRGGAVASMRVNIGEPAPVAQTIENGTIRVTVTPTGGPKVYVDQDGPAGPMGWVKQYYNESAWGTVLWQGSSASFTSGYRTGSAPGGLFSPVSNAIETIDGGKRIVTVFDAPALSLRITQTFTLMDGDRFVTKAWSIRNTGETARDDLSLYHGGDTYFGGTDSASSYYDPAKSMVYVRNTEFASWGIMGFYANPGTPAAHYFSGQYGTGNGFAVNGMNLPDTANPTFLDAGYYLQWDRPTLAAGDTWRVEAYELWTPGGPLQLLAPGPQNVAPGSTVVLPFTLQNLSEVPQGVTLSAAATGGWSAEVVGTTTPSLGAVATSTVLVRVTVPDITSGVSDIMLSATGPESDTSASTRLSVVDIDLSAVPAELAIDARPGQTAWKSVVFTNTSSGPVTLGALSVPAPFVLAPDAPAGVTLGAGESVEIAVGFSPADAGTFDGMLTVSVVSPELIAFTVPVTGVARSTCTLTYTAGPGGSIEGSTTQVVVMGSDASTVIARPSAGYRFAGWSDGVATAARTDLAVGGDRSVTANFEYVPVARDDAASTYSRLVWISPLANDDTGVGAVVDFSQPSHGIVVRGGVGGADTLGYTPAAGFSGTDTFTYYTASGAAATVRVTVLPALSAPQAVTVARESSTSAAVSWSTPVHLGPGLAGYSVVWRTAGTGAWNTGPRLGPATLSTTIGGLVPEVDYEFRVVSLGSDGVDAASAPVALFLHGDAPAGLIIPPLTIPGAHTTTVTVQGLEDGVQTRISAFPAGAGSARLEGPTLHVTPAPGFSGTMRVEIVVTRGSQATTSTATVLVQPGAPYSVTFSPSSSGATLVQWAGSTNARGYRVYVNGRLVGSTGASSSQLRVPMLLGPNAVVQVMATGDDGTESTRTRGAYRAARAVNVGTVRFVGDSPVVSAAGKRVLRRLAAIVKAQGFKVVEVDGYTARFGKGSAAARKRLSEARARNVRTFLLAELRRIGVRDVKVIAVGRGAARPVGSNLTESGRVLNRRAEIGLR